MSSIPLPALDIKPPQQEPNLLSQYAQLQQLRNQQTMQPLQQQAAQQTVQSGAIDLQMKQQQLKDQQAMSATMQQWGKQSAPASSGGAQAAGTSSQSASSLPSYDDLVPLAIKNGASFQAVQQLQAHVLDMKSKASEIAKNDAQTGASNAEAMKTKNGLIVDAMSGVLNTPDAQLPQAIQQTTQQLSQAGLFDPQHVQQAMQLAMMAQQNPNQARQALQVQANSLGAFSKLLEDSQKQVTIRNEQGKTDPNSPLYSPSADAVAMGTAPGSQQIQAGQAAQAGRVAQAEAPVRIATAQAEGIARANVEAQMARGSSAALAQVPPHLVAPAAAAATKAGEDYAQAQSVSQRMAAIMDAAHRGNVVSYQVLPQEGTLQITTSQGVHRISMAEIQNYGGGNAVQKFQGILGKAVSGKSIPDSVLSDMGEIQSIMQKGAQSKYENSLATINQTYGANFKPLPMNGGQQPASQGGGQQFSHVSASGKFGWDGSKWVPIQGGQQ